MAEIGMLLLIHGEVTTSDVDIFDREKVFIDQHLAPISQQFPDLKIVFEHITTSDAADFVLASEDNIAATITPQHLLLNRNDLLVGGHSPAQFLFASIKAQLSSRGITSGCRQWLKQVLLRHRFSSSRQT